MSSLVTNLDKEALDELIIDEWERNGKRNDAEAIRKIAIRFVRISEERVRKAIRTSRHSHPTRKSRDRPRPSVLATY
jgi:hypothetical protein